MDDFPSLSRTDLDAVWDYYRTHLSDIAAQNVEEFPDEQVLAFATGDSRAVLTLNRRDFFRLHRRGIEHEGIVACTADADHKAQAVRIDTAVRALPGLTGQLVRINKTS
jgi:hypothetical protein